MGGTWFGLLIPCVSVGGEERASVRMREDTALSELCSNRFHDLIGNLVNLLKHLVV